MKNLSEFLTKNPILVVVLFLLSITSAIVTLLLGAEDIYNDYLSRSISIPAWFVLLFVIVTCIGWVIYGSRTRLRRTRPHELVADVKFGVERIEVGNKRFLGCTFDGTELVIDGRPFDFNGCHFVGQRFLFSGCAAQTLSIMAAMYRDPPFRPLIEGVMTQIKSDKVHGRGIDKV